MAEHRRHVHDRTGAAGDHRRRAQLRQVPERGDVDLHRCPETLQLLVLDGNRAADPGVVHEHVDATEPIEHVGNETFAIGLAGHVGDAHVRARQCCGE